MRLADAGIAALLLALLGVPLSAALGLGLGPLAIAAAAALAAGAAAAEFARRGRAAVAPGRPAAATALLLSGALLAGLHPWAELDRSLWLVHGTTLAAYVLLYFGLAGLLALDRDGRLRRALLLLVAAAAALHLGVGLFRWLSGRDPRMAGLFGNPNFLASSVAASAFLFLPLALRARRGGPSPGWLAALSGGLALTLALTASRAGLLAPLVAAMVGAASRGRAFFAKAALALAAVVAVVALVPSPLRDRLGNSAQNQSYSRPFLWRCAAENALEHPLGVGPGMNEFWFPRKAFDPAVPEYLHRRHEIGLAHNLFLGAAVELGLLGVAGLLLFAADFLLRQRFAARAGQRTPLGDGAFLAALLLLVHAQFDGLAQSPLAMGLLVPLLALHRAEADRAVPAAAPAGRVWGRSAALLLALPAALPLLPLALAWRSSSLARAGSELAAAGDLAGADAAFAASSAALPWSPAGAAGRTLLAVRRFELGLDPAFLLEAERLTAEQAERNPCDAGPHRRIADLRVRAHYLLHRPDDLLLDAARTAYSRTLLLDPLDVGARYARGRLARLLGDDAAAAADFRRVLELERDFASAYEGLAGIAAASGDPAAELEFHRRALTAVIHARKKLGSGRFGAAPALAEMTRGFSDGDCVRRIHELERMANG